MPVKTTPMSYCRNVDMMWLLKSYDEKGKKLKRTHPFTKKVKEIERFLDVLTLAWPIDNWWEDQLEVQEDQHYWKEFGMDVVYDLNLEVEWVHYTSTKFSRKVLHFREKHPSPAERRQARAFRAQCEHARKMFKKTLTAIPED